MSNQSHYDLVVIGGGPAGFPAAVQAARMGAKVLLVEKSGQLGGTTTLNKVAAPGLFHAWGKQIIAGIGWDLVRRTLETEGTPLPDFSDATARHYMHQPRICPSIMAALIDEDVKASGAHLLFHTMPAGIEPLAGGAGWTVQLCGKEGLFTVTTSWVIDATGDANAALMAGCPLREKSPELQPATLVFCLEGYDPARLDIAAIDAAAMEELAQGRLLKTDFGWTGKSFAHLMSTRGKNSVHIPHVDATTSAGKTDAELKGREALLRIYRFLKTQPGLADLKIGWSAPECGIRETRSIVGRATITVDDYATGKLWPDAVSNSFYPIDLHTDEGLKYRLLEPGRVPTIPLGAMIPEGVPRFLAAGRCISGDRLANSAFRVQASCMGMGQAAGAVVALAAKHGLSDAARVPRDILRTALEEQGAIFPG